MEQKKTLFIIAAVGAFLLVVLGFCFIRFKPESKLNSQVPAITYQAGKKSNNTTSGWTNPPVENTSPVPVYPQETPVTAKVNDMVVIADNATVYDLNKNQPESTDGTTIDLNTLKREITQEIPSSVQPQSINITVNIPEPAKETIITTTPEYKAETEKTTVATVEQPNKIEPKKENTSKAVASKNTKPAEKNTVTVKATPKKTPAAKAAEPAKPVQFWVQVSAYGSKKGAENARSILDENKIPSDIFTYKDNKDKLFYRVRVGPYTTKSEAEYWRSKIIQINEFSKAESFVTSTN